MTEAKYTEEQHFAIVEAAVERETSQLTAKNAELEAEVASLRGANEELESANAGLQNRNDVLEAEKSAALTSAAESAAAFEAFKNELAEQAELETRKAERIAAVRAVASGLGDDYFTAERAERWAEMSEKSFEDLLLSFKDVASVRLPETDESEQARESAAFKGGTAPTSVGASSTLMSVFRASGFGTGN